MQNATRQADKLQRHMMKHSEEQQKNMTDVCQQCSYRSRSAILFSEHLPTIHVDEV